MTARLVHATGNPAGQFEFRGFKASEPPRLIVAELVYGGMEYTYHFLLSAQRPGLLVYNETHPCFVHQRELEPAK